MGLPRQIPPEERRPEQRPQIVYRRKDRLWWPILGVIVALIILAAIVYYLPRGPKKLPPPSAAQVPQQSTPGTVQLSDLSLASAPTGGSAALQGTITNTGNTSVTGITVDAVFYDNRGQVVQRQTVPMRPLQQGAAGTATFADSPLKPSSSMLFRVQLDNKIPSTWNHQVPELRIVDVQPPSAVGQNIPTGGPQGNVNAQVGTPAPQGQGAQPQQETTQKPK